MRQKLVICPLLYLLFVLGLSKTTLRTMPGCSIQPKNTTNFERQPVVVLAMLCAGSFPRAAKYYKQMMPVWLMPVSNHLRLICHRYPGCYDAYVRHSQAHPV